MANRCTTIEEALERIYNIIDSAENKDNPVLYVLDGFKEVAEVVPLDLYPEIIKFIKEAKEDGSFAVIDQINEESCFTENADFDRIRADIEEKARNLSQYEETVVRKSQVKQQLLKGLFGENLYTAQYYLRSAKNGFGLVQCSSDTGIPGLIDTFLANRKNQKLVRNQDIAENVRNTKQALLDKVLEFMRNQKERNKEYIDREVFSKENTRLFDRNGEYLNTLDPETDLYNVITSWFNPKNIAMSNGLDTKYTLFKIENDPEAREYIDAYTAWTLLTNFDTTLILTLGNSVLITEPSNFNKISNVSYKTNIDKATNMWSFGFGDDVEDVGDLISDITKLLVESSKRYSWKVNVPNLDSYLSFKDFNYIIGKVKNLAFTLRGKSDIDLEYYINGKNIITNENVYNLSGTTRGVYENFKEFNKSIGKENDPVTLGQLIAFASENPMRSLHAIFDILCNTDILTTRIKSFTDTDKNLLWSCYKEIFGQCGENSRSLFDLHHNTNGDTIFSIIAQLADSMFLEDIIQYYEDDNKALYAQFMRDYTINQIRNELAQLILQSSSATLSKGAKEFTDAYNVKIEFTNKGQLTTTDKQAWEVGTEKETVPVQAKLIAEIKIPVKITRNGKKIEAGEIIATATNIKFEPKDNITEEEIWNSGDFRELIKDATGINFGADPDFAQAYQLMFQGASEINYTALLDDITRIVGRSVFNNYFNTKLVPLILHEFSLTWNQPNINNIAYSLFMNVESIPRVDPKTGLIPSIPSADKNLVLDKLSQAKAISNNIYTSALVKTGEGTALAAYCLSRLRNSYQYLLVTQNRAAWSASKDMTFVDNKNGLFNKVFTSREVKLSATVKPSTKMSSVELWSLNFYNDWVSAFVKKTRTNSPNGDGACCFIPSVNSDKGQYDKLGCNLNALSHIKDIKGNPIAYRNLTSDQIVDEICMEFGPFYRNVINNITKEWDRVLSVILSNESLETDASGNKTALTKICEDAVADINLISNPVVKWRKLLKFIDKYFSGKKEKTLDGLYRITTKYNMTHTRNPIQLAEQIHYTKGDDGLSVNKVLVALWARFGGAATEEDLKLAKFTTQSYYRESLDLAKITQLYYRESLDLDLLNLLKKTVSAEVLSKETISAATLSKELFDKIPDDNPLKEEVRAARRASVQSNAKGFFRMRDFESVIKLLKNGCKIYLYGAKAREQAETEFLRNFGKTSKDKKSPWVTDSGMMAFVRVTGEDGREYPTNNFNDLIEAQNSGRNWEVHPLISKLNRMHYLTTQQYTCCVGGSVYAYKGKSGSNVLEEEANRWLASNKRNVCYTATIHKFLNKLLNGSPTTYNYAIFDDIDAALYNVMGELNVHTPLDGGMLVNSFLPDLENASLGGEAAGTDKKHFGTFYLEKYGAGGITKTAGFAATNERMRNSEAWRIVLYNMSHRTWVKEFGNANGDIPETELDITKDYDGNDINWPDKKIFYYRELKDGTIKFYRLSSIEKTNNINEYKIYEVPVDESGGDIGQPELREITVIDNNWDLFTKVFGGYRSLGREVSSTGVENPNSRLTYSERSRKLMVEAINRIGYRKVSARKYSMIDKLGNEAEAYTKAATREDRHEDDQDDVWLPLKYSDIHFMPNIGAIKSAQMNVNPPEVLSQKMDLNVMPVERPKLGIQLDKEHSADDAELSMPTQIITACANKGYTLTKTDEMYRAISTLTELAIEDCMKGIMDLVPGGENRGLLKAQIAQIIVDKLILSKDDNEALHAVLGFLEDKVKAGGKVSPEDVQNIPWSDTLIYNKLYSDIASHLTSQAIKLKLSGSMAVICPTHYLERFYGNKRLAALVDLIPGGIGEKLALLEYQRKIREENYEGGLIYDRTRDSGKSEIELLNQASKINTQHIYHLEYINPLTGEVDPNTKQITVNYPMQYYQLRDEIVKFRQASLEELKGALAVTRADGTILVSKLEDIDPEAFYAYISGEARDAEGKVIVSSELKRKVFEQLKNSGYTIDSLKTLLRNDPRKILAFLKFHELSHKKYKDNITINTRRSTKQSSQTTQFTWNRTSDNSYEVSSKGDKRFSALYATFKKGTVIDGVDVGGMTIEDVYQKVIKKSGKGKAPSQKSRLNLNPTNTSETKREAFKQEVINKYGNPLNYSVKEGIITLNLEKGTLELIPFAGLVKDNKGSSMGNKDINYFVGGLKIVEDLAEGYENYSYYEGYLPLWQEWARQNPELIEELRENAKGKTLTDRFANTRVSLARALAEILNSTIDNPVPKVSLSTNGYRKGDPQKHPDVNYVFTENAEAYMVSQDTGTADTGTLLPSTWLEALEKFPNKGRTILNVSDVGGTNQAGIRTDNKGNISPNAYGIVVKKYQQDANGRFVAKEGQFQDTDEDFNLFVRLNEDMFRRLSESSNKKIVFPTQMGLGKAALPKRFAEWLQSQLFERFGISSSLEENTRANYDGYGLSLTSISTPYKVLSTQEEIPLISNNTESFGVIIDPNLRQNWQSWQKENPTGIVAYRVNFNIYNTPEEAQAGRIGNPFSEGIGQNNKGSHTVQKFFTWLVTGNNFGEAKATEEYRQAIINKILSSPENTPILYYKELGRPSHATVLGYLIRHKNLLSKGDILSDAVIKMEARATKEAWDKMIEIEAGSINAQKYLQEISELNAIYEAVCKQEQKEDGTTEVIPLGRELSAYNARFKTNLDAQSSLDKYEKEIIDSAEAEDLLLESNNDTGIEINTLLNDNLTVNWEQFILNQRQYFEKLPNERFTKGRYDLSTRPEKHGGTDKFTLDHTQRVVESSAYINNLPESLKLSLLYATLLHDIGKPFRNEDHGLDSIIVTNELFKSFPNEKLVKLAVRYHMVQADSSLETLSDILKTVEKYGVDLQQFVDLLLALKTCDIINGRSGSTIDLYTGKTVKETVQSEISTLRKRFSDIISYKENTKNLREFCIYDLDSIKLLFEVINDTKPKKGYKLDEIKEYFKNQLTTLAGIQNYIQSNPLLLNNYALIIENMLKYIEIKYNDEFNTFKDVYGNYIFSQTLIDGDPTVAFTDHPELLNKAIEAYKHAIKLFLRKLLQKDLINLSLDYKGKRNVMIGGKVYNIDGDSITPIAYELIMPKIYKTIFGLLENDDLQRISADKNFFARRGISRLKNQIGDDSLYDYQLKRFTGDHMYIFDANHGPIPKGLITSPNFHLFTEQDGSYSRVDAEGNVIYPLSSKDDEVMMTADGVEVIVTKNPAFFIENNNSNAITFSNSRVNEERMQDIVNKLKNSTTNNGRRFIRTFTDRNGKIKNFSTLNKRNRMFADLKESILESNESTGDADLDRLVAEISQEGLKVHASFLKSLDVIAGRIPAQSQLSFMTQKVAAFTNSDINSAYVSVFLLFILGSDLDIDTVNLIGAGFDRLGHYVLWSPYANLGNSELIKASEQLPFPTGLATEITYDNSKDSFFITFNDFFGKNKLFNIELDPNTGDVVRNEQGVYKISFDSESPTAIKQLAEFLNLVEKVGLNLKGNVDQYGNHQYSEELDAEIYAQNLRYRDLGIFTDLHIKPSQLLNVLQQIKEIVDKHNLYIKKVDKRTKEIMAKNLSYCRMFEIAGDPSNLMEAQDSIDNSTKVIKGPEGAVKVTMTEEDKNLVSSNNETKSFPDPVSMVDSLQTNQVGKYDVSVAAKAVQACSMIQYAYDSLLNSDAPEEKKRRLELPNGGYKIAGKQWTAIANLHDKTHEETGEMQLPDFIKDMLKVLDDETVEKINSAIQNAAMLSVAVDNAKDLSLGKINAGPAMLGMYAYGITLGIDVVTLAKIINSPQGRAISKALSGNVFTGDMGFSSALQAINFLNGLNLTRFLTQFDYADNRGSKTLFNAFRNIAAKELSRDLNDKCAQEIQERTTKSITKVVEILLRKGQFDRYLNLIQKTSSWGYSEKLLFEALKEYNALIQLWHGDENKQHDLEILSLGAEEIRVLGVLLGSNKGVKTKIEDGINFINTLENIISDRYKIMHPDADESKIASLKIDYLRFCTDKEYMEWCIDEYDKVKHTVNILLVAALCPHIFSYLRASIIPHAGFMSASSKYRSTLAVINSGIYSILGIRAAKDKSNSLKGLNNEINAMMLMLWLSDTQKVFYLPRGLRYFKSGTNELVVYEGKDPLPISLWTPEGLATFKLYMELCILPELQRNSAFEDNKFVKNLSPFTLSLTGTRATVSAYTLTGNLLPKAGTAEEALLREYQAAFEAIRNTSFPYKEYKKDTSEGSTIGTYGDALYLYSEYVFGGRKGPNSLMALFELGNNELQKLFRKAKADMDKNRDFKLTIMQKLRSMALMSNIFNPKYSYYYAVNNTDIGVNFYKNEEKTLTAKEKDARAQEAAELGENYGSIISKRAMFEKEGYENGEEQVQNFLYPELTTPSSLEISLGDVQVTFKDGKITDWNINPKVALDTFKISGDNDSEIIENFNNSNKEEIKNTIAEIDNIVKMINDNIDMTYTGVYVDGTVVTEIRNLDIVQTALELAVLKGTGKC